VETVQCSNCGARYMVDRHKTIMRDKDNLNCQFCGEVFYSWNEASIWYVKEVLEGPMTENET
jgi:predicted Zn finger-like uncharacterized protein